MSTENIKQKKTTQTLISTIIRMVKVHWQKLSSTPTRVECLWLSAEDREQIMTEGQDCKSKTSFPGYLLSVPDGRSLSQPRTWTLTTKESTTLLVKVGSSRLPWKRTRGSHFNASERLLFYYVFLPAFHPPQSFSPLWHSLTLLFHFCKSNRSLLSSSGSSPLSLTPSVSSSSRHAESPQQEREICQGRAIRVTTDWYRPGDQRSKLRLVQLLAARPNCEQARCDWWTIAPYYRHKVKLKERRIEWGIFFPADHFWTQGVTQGNLFTSCQDWRNRTKQTLTLISGVDRHMWIWRFLFEAAPPFRVGKVSRGAQPSLIHLCKPGDGVTDGLNHRLLCSKSRHCMQVYTHTHTNAPLQMQDMPLETGQVRT